MLCEKPMTLKEEEARELFGIAEREELCVIGSDKDCVLPRVPEVIEYCKEWEYWADL